MKFWNTHSGEIGRGLFTSKVGTLEDDVVPLGNDRRRTHRGLFVCTQYSLYREYTRNKIGIES